MLVTSDVRVSSLLYMHNERIKINDNIKLLMDLLLELGIIMCVKKSVENWMVVISFVANVSTSCVGE